MSRASRSGCFQELTLRTNFDVNFNFFFAPKTVLEKQYSPSLSPRQTPIFCRTAGYLSNNSLSLSLSTVVMALPRKKKLPVGPTEDDYDAAGPDFMSTINDLIEADNVGSVAQENTANISDDTLPTATSSILEIVANSMPFLLHDPPPHEEQRLVNASFSAPQSAARLITGAESSVGATSSASSAAGGSSFGAAVRSPDMTPQSSTDAASFILPAAMPPSMFEPTTEVAAFLRRLPPDHLINYALFVTAVVQ